MATAAGNASIDINAQSDRIMDVVMDINSYPQWIKEMKEAQVVETDAEGRPARASFVVDVKVKKVRYDLLYSYAPNVISWHTPEGGDVDEIKGSYELKPATGKTHVEYNYAIDPGFPMPGPLRSQAVKLIVGTALKGLKKRVESL